MTHYTPIARWALSAFVLASTIMPGAPVLADDAAGKAEAMASDETKSALESIRREAEQKRAERLEMEQLRREVDRSTAADRRRPKGAVRPQMTQQQLRAMRARQRRQVQSLYRGAPVGSRPPAFGTLRSFRTPNGGGFVMQWGAPQN